MPECRYESGEEVRLEKSAMPILSCRCQKTVSHIFANFTDAATDGGLSHLEQIRTAGSNAHELPGILEVQLRADGPLAEQIVIG